MTWTADENIEPPPRPIGRRKLLWAAGALVAIFAVAVIYFFSRDEVGKELAAIRARSEPTTLGELALYYQAPPPGQDATRLWLDAAQSLTATSQGKLLERLPFFGAAEHPPLLGQPWPEIDFARRFLQANSAAMQQLHDAAALGGQARYPVDFGPGINTLLDYVQRLRQAGRCLALEANVRAREGDMHGAAESLRTGLLLSQSLKNEPMIVSQLVRIAMHGMIVGELKRIGPVNFPPQDLLRLQQTLSEIEFAEGMQRSVVGDRVLGRSAFDNPDSIGMPNQMLHYVVWVNREADESAYLKAMADLVALTELPWPRCIEETKAWSENLAANSRRRNVLTNLLTTGAGLANTAFARGETVNRLALVDVAIARYTQQHGQPPAELEALSPEFLAQVPLDPTTDSPFTYQATADSFLLFTPSKVLFPPAAGGPALFGSPASKTSTATTNNAADPTIDVNPWLIFRWPPLPDETPAVEDEAEETPDDGTEEGAAAAGEPP